MIINKFFKSILIGGLITMTTGYSHAQKTTFSCDFEEGIPTTFATYDLDNLEPSRAMKKYGFEVGVSWVTYTEDNNSMALSGSWYTESGQSNDWLVTPAIEIKSTRDILSWYAQTFDVTHPDGYKIYISEKGNKPEDFTDEPIFSLDAENGVRTQHYVSLEKYVGKEVHIAFVNDSYDCNLLAIDDINVFSYDNSFNFINYTPEAINTTGTVKVSGAITSSGFLPVEGYTVELSYDGKTYAIDNSSLIIAPGEVSEFSFDTNIHVESDKTTDYVLTITSLNGTDVMTYYGSVTAFQRMMLIEEGTGIWCQYCPRGQYGLQQLHLEHPGTFVDIAVHFSDPMEVSGYKLGIYNFFSSLPYCVFDRNHDLMGDPYNDRETLWQAASQIGSVAKISCEATYTDDNMVNIFTTAEFGKKIEENVYSLAFVIVEDKMTGYYQQNAFSGTDIDLGGIEDMPEVIPAGEYEFANVARAILPSFAGDSEAFPVGTERHTPITLEHHFELTPKIQNFDNVKVVAIITENSTGKAVNVCETPLKNLSGIKDINTTDKFSITTERNQIKITGSKKIQLVEIWSADGRLITQSTPDSTETLIDKTHSGMVIIKITSDSNTTIKKQIW